MEQMVQDRRIRRTRRQLQRAMLELLQEKDVRSITVQELTQRADINRGTFYAHYRDIFDLLEQMERDLFDRLEGLLSSYSAQDLQVELTPLLADMFGFVRDDPVLRLTFLDQHTQDSFFRRLHQLILKKCADDWQGLYLPEDLKMWNGCLDFLVSGVVGLARGWMKRGFEEDPKQLAKLANQLILTGLTLPMRDAFGMKDASEEQ